MSNWVDFFEGECRDLAVPAGRCEVFVEGGDSEGGVASVWLGEAKIQSGGA
jgi:hypothetical protein